MKIQNKLHRQIKSIFLYIVCFLSFSVEAADIVNSKNIGMELARDIANEAVMACRNKGYHVSAVVVDRYGLIRAILRDDLAARFTIEIAQRKANMTVMAWTDSGAFKKARSDIQQELNHIEGLIVMEGGIKITTAGYNLGAVGVSGAPGGDKDADCGKKALKKLEERIEFSL